MNTTSCIIEKSGETPPLLVGYGTWKLSVGEEAVTAVKNAIASGYRHIDTAAAYGNEASVGEGIRNSGIDRNLLYVSNKLWNTKRNYEAAMKACKSSLKRMSLDYFDLYLIHWPASQVEFENWREINAETWRAMEALYKEGFVKEIGVCNCLQHHLEAIIQNADILPIVDQIEYHPGYVQEDISVYCRKLGIRIEAWSPLGNGKLVENDILKGISKKYNKSVAQICIRWCIQKKVMPIVKTASPVRMKENLDIMDFMISEEDMVRINTIPSCGESGLYPDKINIF